MTAPFPPGPSRAMGLRYLMQLRGDPASFLLYVARRYGDAVYWQFGRQNIFLFSHPDAVRDILVTNHRQFVKSPVLRRARSLLGNGLLTSEGDVHLRQRRLIQPAFHRQRVSAYGDVMADYARRLSVTWQPGETRDISDEMMALTLTIVGATLFGADVEADVAAVAEAMDVVMGWSLSPLLTFMPRFERWRLPFALRLRDARAEINTVVGRLIAERRATGDRGDMLSMLLAAQDVEGDGRGMSDQQIRDEAVTIFLAGHETTANALTWTWYLLSQHPAVEARLHAEVDAALGGRRPTADDVARLPYTRQVLAESMRLFPPAWSQARQATADVEINGWHVPAGSMVLFSQYVIHRDPRFFPDPARFDPGRFTPEAQAARPRYAYFPFGAGPRICIGEPFAWLEGVLLLAALAQQWQLRLDPAQRIAVKPLITLRPKYGMRMRLERRRDATRAVAEPADPALATLSAD